MALDPAVADQLTLTQLLNTKQNVDRMNTYADNLVQGLGVVNTTLIHQHGSTADDAATMAALRTAIHIPAKD